MVHATYIALLFLVHPLQEWISTSINAFKVFFLAMNQECVEIYWTLFLMSKFSTYGEPTVGLKIRLGKVHYRTFRTFKEDASKMSNRELKTMIRRLIGCFQISKRTQW